MEYVSDFEKSPIIGIYILDLSGLPLLARHYYDKITENQAILLAGFFSAIDIFCRTSLKSTLTDIGIEGKRFFFQVGIKKYIKVVMIETTQSRYIDQNKINLVDICHKRINYTLEIVSQYAKENSVDIEELIRELGMTIDSIVFESSLENISEDKEIDAKILQGTAVDQSKFDDIDILEQLKDIFGN